MKPDECKKNLDAHLSQFHERYQAAQKAKYPEWRGDGLVGCAFVTPERARAMEVEGACAIIPVMTGELATFVRSTWTERPDWNCNPSQTNICLVAMPMN